MQARLAENPEDWQWSSFGYYAFGDGDEKFNELIDIDPYYEKLGDNINNRRSCYRENIAKITDNIFLKKTRRQFDRGIYGNEKFIQNMKNQFNIGSINLPDRPRKPKNQS